MKLLAAVPLVACALSLCLALPQTTWKFDNAPEDGLLDITFPIHIASSSHTQGYNYAQKLTFLGVTDYAVLSLMPLGDENGKRRFDVQFMTLTEGTTTTNPNCTVPTGDNASGVICLVRIYRDYTHPYSLVVENVGGTTWRGKVVDTQDHVETLVGEWTLPPEAGNINAGDGQQGFVGYIPWRTVWPPVCSTLPRTEVQLFNPTSKTAGASGGKLDSVYWMDDCEVEANYSSTIVPGGFDLKFGVV